jgi:hypothetical protein
MFRPQAGDLVLRARRRASGAYRCATWGPYPSQTGARVTADYLTAELPVGAGDVRYYIEAEDGRGNCSRGALERSISRPSAPSSVAVSHSPVLFRAK